MTRRKLDPEDVRPGVMYITAENIADKLTQGMPGYWEDKSRADAEKAERLKQEATDTVVHAEPVEEMMNFDSIEPGTVNRFAPFVVHPVAALFPLMSDAELAILADDIKENGQREDILISPDETVIFDGRSRFLACKIVGVEPRLAKLFDPKHTKYDEAGIIRYIISANLHRRHLSVADRAFLAVELEKRYAIAAKERQGTRTDLGRNIRTDPSESSKQAARAVGVGQTAVKQAKKLAAEAPDLAEQVKAGGLSLNAAAKAHKARSEQPEQGADEDHHADEVARKRVAAQGSDLEAMVRAYGKEPKPEPKHSAIATVLVGEIRKANRALRKALKQYHDKGLCFVGEDREWANECLDEVQRSLDQLREAAQS